MEQIEQAVELLACPAAKAACAAMKELLQASCESDAVYPFFGRFAALLRSKSSYERTRGLVLMAANARWDTQDELSAALDAYLCHILDEKPITARQCIQCLPEIARHKPALRGRILCALAAADTACYADSMRPLVERDIASALRAIEAME